MRNEDCDREVIEAELSVMPELIDKAINKIDRLLEDERQGIQRYPRNNADIIQMTKERIPNQLRDLFDAQYSADSVVMDYEKIVSLSIDYTVEKELTERGYISLLRLVSQGILVEIEKEKMQLLADKLDADKYNDILVDYLLRAYGIERKFKSTRYCREIPYSKAGKICECAVDDKEKAGELLFDYISKDYLNGHKDLDWHKAAKKWSKYLGLWSYEAAAITKLFGIDDSALKNVPNYPYDLVRYKNGFVPSNSLKFEVQENWGNEMEENEAVYGIALNPDIEGIIAPVFHSKVNELIEDFMNLADEVFWNKYALEEAWFSFDDYIDDKKTGSILGMLIVFLLADEGYILQIDYKEELEDYIDEVENYWGDSQTKLITFDLDNDQQYYARIPVTTNVTNIYEVVVKEVD